MKRLCSKCWTEITDEDEEASYLGLSVGEEKEGTDMLNFMIGVVVSQSRPVILRFLIIGVIVRVILIFRIEWSRSWLPPMRVIPQRSTSTP